MLVTHLRVPPVRAIQDNTYVRAVEDRVRARAAVGQSFLSTFGLEIKAAALLALDAHEAHRLTLQRFVSRPAVEPILLLTWAELCGGLITSAHMIRYASGCLGKPVELARGRMRTSVDGKGNYAVFAEQADRSRICEFLAENEALNSDRPLSAALAAYCLTIICHPLTDGNGRLARGLVSATLGRCGVLKAPVLPLGPAMRLKAPLIARTLSDLSDSGDWEAAVLTLAGAIDTACDLADAVERMS